MKLFCLSKWSLRLLRLLSAIMVLTIFFLLLWNANRGFEITDESFYILNAQNPQQRAQVTLFGHYTGILLSLSNHNLAIFRMLGIFILLLATTALCFSLERYWQFAGNHKPYNYSWLTIGIALASSMAYYCPWLLTPSYNWLALVSTIIVASGLLFAASQSELNNPKSQNTKLYASYLVVGFGGVLSFMAKPTTCAFLALICVYWLIVTPLRYRWKGAVSISTICAVAFFIAHLLFLDKGFTQLYTSFKQGLIVARLQEAHSFNTMLHGLYLLRLDFLYLAITLSMLACVLAIDYKYCKNRQKDGVNFVISFIVVSVSMTLAMVVILKKVAHLHYAALIGLYFISILLLYNFAIIIGQKSGTKHFDMRSCLITIAKWRQGKNNALYGLLLLLPVGCWFGSSNLLFVHLSFDFLFLAVGSLYVSFEIGNLTGRYYLADILAFLISFGLLVVIISAYRQPYRLPQSIAKQNTPITLTATNGTLYVDKLTAKYVNDMKNIAFANGWKVKTPLIDLSGESPGSHVILDAKIMGLPWLIGGYPGSDKVAHMALKKESKSTLQSAWLLISPQGAVRLSYPKILSDLQLKFPGNYDLVGTLTFQRIHRHRKEIQQLWRPKIDQRPARWDEATQLSGHRSLLKLLSVADIYAAESNYVNSLYFNIDGAKRPVLFEHPPANSQAETKVVFPLLKIAQGNKLVFGIAILPEMWGKSDGVRFSIDIETASGYEQIFSRFVNPKSNADDRKWHDFTISLSKYSGKSIRLIFKTQNGQSNYYDHAGWSNPSIAESNRGEK